MGVADELVPRRCSPWPPASRPMRHGTWVPSTGTLPGELAPKLALGLRHRSGPGSRLGRRLVRDRVPHRSRPSHRRPSGWPAAAPALGDRTGAIAAYERVPETLQRPRRRAGSRRSAVLLDGTVRAARLRRHPPRGDDRRAAARSTASSADRLSAADPGGRPRRSCGAMRRPRAPTTTVLGHPLTDRDLRLGLESTYRSLARHAGTDAERIALVDRANHDPARGRCCEAASSSLPLPELPAAAPRRRRVLRGVRDGARRPPRRRPRPPRDRRRTRGRGDRSRPRPPPQRGRVLRGGGQGGSAVAGGLRRRLDLRRPARSPPRWRPTSSAARWPARLRDLQASPGGVAVAGSRRVRSPTRWPRPSRLWTACRGWRRGIATPRRARSSPRCGTGRPSRSAGRATAGRTGSGRMACQRLTRRSLVGPGPGRCRAR